MLDGLRGETSIAELCRREGIAESMYYSWSRSSWRPASAGSPATQRGPRRPMRSSSSGARRQDLKEVVAEQALELRLLKHDRGWGSMQRGSPHLRSLRSSVSSSNRTCRPDELCRCSGSSHRHSIAGMTGSGSGGPEALEDKPPSPIGSGTAFPMMFASALS